MKAGKSNKNSKGFTLVELIVVLVILGILIALLIPALTGYIDKAKQRAVLAECRQAVTAAQTLYTESYSDSTTPKTSSIEELAEVPGTVSNITAPQHVIEHLTYTRSPYTVTYCKNYKICEHHEELYNIGKTNGSGADTGGSGSETPGTDDADMSKTILDDGSTLIVNGKWTEILESLSKNGWVNYSGIYKDSTGTYFVPYTQTLTGTAPISLGDIAASNNSVYKVSSKVYDESNLSSDGSSWIQTPSQGDIIHFEGKYYFVDMESSPNKWTKGIDITQYIS